MRKRPLYLALFMGLLVLAAVVFAAARSTEPQYGGVSLSEWVSPVNLPPNETTHEPVVHALRQMGANAVPYLVRWMNYRTPPWKSGFYRAVNPILNRLRPGWKLDDRKEVARAKGAILGLIVLGPQAEGAVKDLSNLLGDTNRSGPAVWAPEALASIGKPGLPPLISALTNHQTTPYCRCVVANDLSRMGSNALPAIPALRQALTDSDRAVRLSATNVLRRLDPQAFPPNDDD